MHNMYMHMYMVVFTRPLPVTVTSTLLEIIPDLVEQATVTVWSPGAMLVNICPGLPDKKIMVIL